MKAPIYSIFFTALFLCDSRGPMVSKNRQSLTSWSLYFIREKTNKNIERKYKKSAGCVLWNRFTWSSKSATAATTAKEMRLELKSEESIENVRKKRENVTFQAQGIMKANSRGM